MRVALAVWAGVSVGTVALAAVGSKTAPNESIITFDPTISYGNIFTILTIGAAFLMWFRGETRARRDIENDIKRLKEGDKDVKGDIKEIKDEIRELGGVLISMAAYDQRFLNVESNQTRIQKELDDLRSGEGWKLPNFRRPEP